MPFKIQIIDRNVPVRENPIYINHAYHLHMGLNEPIQYETGAQAATVVQERKNQLPPGSPLSFRIVKIESANGESDDSWKERERNQSPRGKGQRTETGIKPQAGISPAEANGLTFSAF